MKSLILALSLILSFSLSAEEMSTADYDQIQIGKINAGYLDMIDKEIKKTEVSIENALGNLGEPVSDQEGKILAGMLNMIDSELALAKELRLELDSQEDILDADAKPIFEKLELIQDLLTGL